MICDGVGYKYFAPMELRRAGRPRIERFHSRTVEASIPQRMKRTLLIAGVALLALSVILLVGGLVQFIIPPTFESVARISIEPETHRLMGTSHQADGEIDISDTSWFQTEMETLQSRIVLYQVITNLDLNRKWGEKFKEGQLAADLSYALLKRQLHIRPARGTALLQIQVRSDDPTEAAAIANGIAEVYRDHCIREKGGRNTVSNAFGAWGQTTTSSVSKTPAVQIVDQAEPNLRPVKPHPLVKILVPVAGLLAGVLGVVLLMLAVMMKDRAEKSPPPLPA